VHGDEYPPVDPTRLVSYLGVLYQALRDISAWVEKGIPPPPSTSYKVVDGQIVVPSTAAERLGIQPVVLLTANGAVRAEVSVGQPVKFSATIQLPPNTGKIVGAEWDFEGEGTYPVAQPVSEGTSNASGSSVTVTITHSFAKPGTYFPALRASSQREGDASAVFARVQNLGRVRVVVR